MLYSDVTALKIRVMPADASSAMLIVFALIVDYLIKSYDSFKVIHPYP